MCHCDRLGLDRVRDLVGIDQKEDHLASMRSVGQAWFSDENGDFF
jgi:hypothetical protein